MPDRLFVVSGCALSGLARTSRVLTALGAPCGHEGVFRPEAFQAGRTLYWPPRVAGDASWYAAPVLGKLPGGTIVLHQTRHPLDTIADLVRTAFFEREGEHRHFVQDFVPETKLGGPVVRCMRFWLEWHRMVEAAADYDDIVYRRVQLESLDAGTFVETAALFGISRSRASAEHILREIQGPAPRPRKLRWDDLPDGKLRDDLVDAAARFGYAA